MQTLWYHYDCASVPLKISFLAMNLGQEGGDLETRKSNTKYMQTFGTYMQITPGEWNISGAFYYQTGKNILSNSVSAYMGSLRASYSLSKTWSVNVGTDYLSGNDEYGETYKAFNPCMALIISFMERWTISMLQISRMDITPVFLILRLELIIRFLLLCQQV